MGLRCSIFGHEWVVIFSKAKTVISYNDHKADVPDRELPRTLIINECAHCRKAYAKLADTIGHSESVDVDVAFHEMAEDRKNKEKPKKKIAVKKEAGLLVFPTDGINFVEGALEAHVFEHRIEIRRVGGE